MNWIWATARVAPNLLPLANWLSLRTFYADIAGSNPVGSTFCIKVCPVQLLWTGLFYHYTPFNTSTGLLLAAFNVCDPIIKKAISKTANKPTTNSAICTGI